MRCRLSGTQDAGLGRGEILFLVLVAIWVFAIVLTDAGTSVPSPTTRRGLDETTGGTAVVGGGREAGSGGSTHGRR